MNKKHTLWIEKYRSQTPKDYIGNENLADKLDEWISEKDIPHLIFNGPAGTGKTTIAKLLVNNIPCDYLYVNASDENGIETIREKIKGFASTRSLNGIKIIILDEADFLTNPAQAALRNLMEEYSANTRFILTCNYIERIIEPLLSRTEGYTLSAPPKRDIAIHLIDILKKENVSFNIEDIGNLVNEYYPDIRSMLKYLQSGSKSKIFKFSTDMQIWTQSLLQLLVNKNNKTWYDVRQLIADSHVKDFIPAYKYLYDNVELYGKGSEAQITIIIDEYSWRSGVVPDKEITFMACISKILENI